MPKLHAGIKAVVGVLLVPYALWAFRETGIGTALFSAFVGGMSFSEGMTEYISIRIDEIEKETIE